MLDRRFDMGFGSLTTGLEADEGRRNPDMAHDAALILVQTDAL